MTKGRLSNPALFICDIQEKFRPAIWEYSKVIATAQKMIKASELLSIPIYATTQKSSALGPLCAELSLPNAQTRGSIHDKTLFSMYLPGIASSLPPSSSAIIVGIEAHICVLQTTLDLLAAGHRVYVLADGVSSCNKEEVPIALRRVVAEGGVVSTSESVLYEVMRDAGSEGFKGVAGLVKEWKERTREGLQTLCKI